eukprot:TRINITY_DN4318_c0_g1_i1.p1 TRINITY_DN4318_c0_g1~~TRINITY_DN4318_c0_g1_i1.p1  ORF type:complete len:478 (+),score=117.48 TRINITY_DN4318_c0_g1_i1:24-1436(+)
MEVDEMSFSLVPAGENAAHLAKFPETMPPLQRWAKPTTMRRTVTNAATDQKQLDAQGYELKDGRGDHHYVGKRESIGMTLTDDASEYVLLVRKDNEFKVVPVRSWYTFRKQSNIRKLTLEEAEAIMSRKHAGQVWVQNHMKSAIAKKREQQANEPSTEADEEAVFGITPEMAARAQASGVIPRMTSVVGASQKKKVKQARSDETDSEQDEANEAFSNVRKDDDEDEDYGGARGGSDDDASGDADDSDEKDAKLGSAGKEIMRLLRKERREQRGESESDAAESDDQESSEEDDDDIDVDALDREMEAQRAGPASAAVGTNKRPRSPATTPTGKRVKAEDREKMVSPIKEAAPSRKRKAEPESISHLAHASGALAAAAGLTNRQPPAASAAPTAAAAPTADNYDDITEANMIAEVKRYPNRRIQMKDLLKRFKKAMSKNSVQGKQVLGDIVKRIMTVTTAGTERWLTLKEGY